MSSRWGSRGAFKRIASQLSVSEGLDFQRKVQPFVELAFANVIESPPLRSWDRAGIDLLSWSDAPERIPVAVQVKGFQTRDHELGDSQIRQVLHSIRAFQSSGVQARDYLVVVNRNGPDEYWAPATAALQALVDSHQALSAQLIRRTELLNRAFDRVYLILEENVKAGAARYYVDLEQMATVVAPIENVPLRVNSMVTDPHGVTSIQPAFEGTADPIQQFDPPPPSRMSIVVGEFGTGKTVTALRAAKELGRPVLLLPGARIRQGTRTHQELLEQFVDTEAVVKELPDGDPRDIDAMVRTAANLLFRQENSPWLLLIDGVDESSYLTAKDGFVTLMNHLEGLRTPVVLTMRSEFWISNLSAASTALELRTRKSMHQRRTHRVIELELWSDALIAEYVSRRCDEETDESRRSRLEELIEVVSGSRYRAYYGDVPTRPLYIMMLSDVVATYGMRNLTRLQLMQLWIDEKLQRDYRGPILVGGEGRVGILPDDTLESRIPLAYAVMRGAARCLAGIEQQVLTFREWCGTEDVRREVPALTALGNWTGVFLNSLLMVDRGQGEFPLRVRFAHQAFLEYFLALEVLREPALWEDVAMPAEVSAWLRELDGNRGEQSRHAPRNPSKTVTDKYHVALSYAGEDRPYVERVAAALRGAGVPVFYDEYERTDMWGKDLATHLDDVYRNQSRYVVMFVSVNYAAKMWPNLERRSALAGAVKLQREFLLPARLDDTELPGLPESIVYVDCRRVAPEELAGIIVEKITHSSGT